MTSEADFWLMMLTRPISSVVRIPWARLSSRIYQNSRLLISGKKIIWLRLKVISNKNFRRLIKTELISQFRGIWIRGSVKNILLNGSKQPYTSWKTFVVPQKLRNEYKNATSLDWTIFVIWEKIIFYVILWFCIFCWSKFQSRLYFM